VNVTKLLKKKHRAFPSLKSGNSVYVTNLEKSNLIANAFSNVYQSHDFNVSTTESEAVETSIDNIHNSIIDLTPNVLGFYNRGKKHNPITSTDKSGWS
jgi:ribosomal protein L13